MKLALIISIFISLACSVHAKSNADLSIYGKINDVEVTEGKVLVVFTGLACLSLNDPSLKDQFHFYRLSRAVIHLTFDNGFKGMHTYSKFRYLDWIDDAKAISLLKEFQQNSSDIMMTINSESLTCLKSKDGMMVSSLKGTLDEVSLWKNLFEESIEEYTKALMVSIAEHTMEIMGVRYELVPGVKQAEQAGADQPATAPAQKAK